MNLQKIELPGFRFDEIEHRYFLYGEEIPGLTSLLKDAGYINTRFYNDRRRREGTRLHQYAELLAAGRLDMAQLEEIRSIRPDFAAKLDQFTEFLSQTGFKPIYLEIPIYNPELVYGTIPDAVGFLGGRLTTIDYKSGGKESWHRLQTAGHKLALTALGIPVLARAALYLSGKGKFQLDPHEEISDEKYFTAAAINQRGKTVYGGSR